MKTFQKKDLTPLLAGVAFLLMAAIKLTHLISGFSFSLLLSFITCIVLPVLLFMKKRNVLISVLMVIVAFPNIYWQFYDVSWTISIGGGCAFPIIINLLYALSHIFIVLLAYISVTKYKEKAKSFWFLPAGFMVAGVLTSLLHRHAPADISLENLMQIAAYALLSMWLAYPDGLPTKIHVTRSSSKKAQATYCELGRHIVLSLFTFGIYHLIWVYRTTTYMSAENELPENPKVKLLLYIFVPFYLIYWTYTSARRIDLLANSKGLKSKRAVICLIIACLAIPTTLYFLPTTITFIFITPLVVMTPSILIIPSILMQSMLNAIAYTENERTPY